MGALEDLKKQLKARSTAVLSGRSGIATMGGGPTEVPAQRPDSAHGAAMESNHPTVGLPRPAGFEDDGATT